MLKAYSFTRTNENGAVENCYITFDGQNCSWTHKSFGVVFENYESQEVSNKEIKRIGDSPKPITTRQPFQMNLTGNGFLSAVSQVLPEEDKDLPFFVIFSNAIWRIALNTPFISDFVEDENGIFHEEKKSLNDLDAVLHLIEI